METSVNSPSAWPGGARIAVLVSVLLEAWEEGRSPSYFPRTTPLKPGARDESGIQWSHYGGQEGIWRLMRIIESHGLRATAFCNGLCVERFPAAIARLAGGGHELAAHGWAQNEYLHEQGPDGQARTIGRTLDALESAAGRRPGGWLTPVYGGDLHTPGLLARAGFAWHCDVLDASAPRREMHHGLPIVGIPWSEFVDNRVLRASPRDYFDAYRGSFDFQYRSEPLALLHIGIHAHFGGRPLVSAMFDEVLRHIRGHEGVWFPTCSELAGFVAAQPVGAFDFRARFFGGRT